MKYLLLLISLTVGASDKYTLDSYAPMLAKRIMESSHYCTWFYTNSSTKEFKCFDSDNTIITPPSMSALNTELTSWKVEIGVE